MRSSWLVVAVGLGGCMPSPARKPWIDPAPVVERLASRATIAIDKPAENYGDAPSVAVVPGPEADSLFRDVLELRPGVQRDLRLDAVAADLSSLVRANAEITEGATEFSLRARGVLESATRVAVVTSGFDLRSLAAELPDSDARVGIGGSPLVIVIVHSMPAVFAPVPRRVELRGAARLLGAVDPRLRSPRFTVTTPGRSPETLVVDGRLGSAFDVRVNCGDAPETRWVTLEAVDAENELKPLARFPIVCGTELSRRYYVEPRENLETSDEARRIIALLNRERIANGLKPLRPDPRLERAAHSYALVMRGANSVAHNLGGSSPADRLREIGVVPPLTIESTLQAANLGAAAEVLWNDPAYRVTFEKREATHVGVGIAPDAHQERYIAIELERIVPVADLENVRRRLQAEIQANSGRPVHVDETLQRFADRAARELAAGGDEEELSKHLGRELRQSLPRETVLDSAQVILRDVDEWNDDLLKTTLPFDTFGVGVAQTARDGHDAGQLWAVVFFAMRVESRL